MALNEQEKAELLKLSPEELVKKLANQNEANDRIAAKAQAAEEARLALEKKATEDAEAARLKDASEVERERIAREKAEKALLDERAALKTERVRSAVRLAAIQAGAADPDDVFALMGTAGLEVDESGQPKNAKEAVAAFLEKKPHLKGKGGNGWVDGQHADTGAARRGGAPDKKQATPEEWGRMNPAEKTKFAANGGRVI